MGGVWPGLTHPSAAGEALPFPGLCGVGMEASSLASCAVLRGPSCSVRLVSPLQTQCRQPLPRALVTPWAPRWWLLP